MQNMSNTAITSKVIYKGGLRTEAEHQKSGNKIITDAPPDNHGKGEAFSPTDLMATSLATCMLTVMGIACNGRNWNMDGTVAEVTKIMESNPRRVAEIHITLKMPPNGYTDEQKKILEHTARTCPVALSLHPKLIQNITFAY
jgi:putative redox protein